MMPRDIGGFIIKIGCRRHVGDSDRDVKPAPASHNIERQPALPSNDYAAASAARRCFIMRQAMAILGRLGDRDERMKRPP